MDQPDPSASSSNPADNLSDSQPAGSQSGSTHTSTSTAHGKGATSSASVNGKHPKSDQLIHDVTSPLSLMKGCTQSMVLAATCACVVAAIVLQWWLQERQVARDQEMYERIQILQIQQGDYTAKCEEMIVRLEALKIDVESVEETVENVEATVEYVEEIVEEVPTVTEETIPE